MAEKNKDGSPKPKYLAVVIVVLLLFSVFGKRMYGDKQKTKIVDSAAPQKKEIQYPYRVIPALDSNI